MDVKSREELFQKFRGEYSSVVGIYHEHLTASTIGHPDSEMMEHLPEPCKWFAHKGAGYDSIDVTAAKKKGENTCSQAK